MEDNWAECKNILCIRPDNMGDLIMTVPAIRALKESIGTRITVLTSSMAAGIARQIEEIDEVIVFDAPWTKLGSTPDAFLLSGITAELQARNFDAAVIFTVYSQNPLPTVMLAYLAGIPLRLAYCRENPYQLLSHWVPDQEPYSVIKHQVQRDLDLVAHIGATTQNKKLSLKSHPEHWPEMIHKLLLAGLDIKKPWLILHAGVSEIKRQFPFALWVRAAKEVINHTGYQIILTGAASEKVLTDDLHLKIGSGSISAGGLFDLEELVLLIDKSPLLLAVNTGTIHIAAAMQTPVVVLYALTNPQHTPWHVPCQVLYFDIGSSLRSRNEVIKYVTGLYDGEQHNYPSTDEILTAINSLLSDPSTGLGNELKLINMTKQQSSLS